MTPPIFKYNNISITCQDCGHAETRNVLRGYGDKISVVEPPPFPADFPIPPKEKKFKGYFKIARHYGWALNHTFQVDPLWKNSLNDN